MTHGANRRVDSDAGRLDNPRTLAVYPPAALCAPSQCYRHRCRRRADLARADRHHAIRDLGGVMTADAIERDMIRDAIATASATETVGKKLGAKLLVATRKVVAAQHRRKNAEQDLRDAELELRAAIRELELLGGRP